MNQLVLGIQVFWGQRVCKERSILAPPIPSDFLAETKLREVSGEEKGNYRGFFLVASFLFGMDGAKFRRRRFQVSLSSPVVLRCHLPTLPLSAAMESVGGGRH